ncbi:DJ-1 family glyoxalase III [Desulfospira joergensenii]|uniref:DJ-1 family glyoxalase III n=1 Tax=Desulfospira joergensenii TaxID=53329 RepID=UPI0003B59018|nr:DJ-1 family glyoxalase III [Desulfospira joergensenii]
MERSVLVPVAQGIEEMEAITIIDVLRRAEARVTVASVDELQIKASRGTVFMADALIKDCMDKEFDLIVLPGGIPGAMNLQKSKELEILLKKQAEKEKYYGAICASPAVVLHHHGLVRPGRVTCHPGFAGQIENGAVLDRNVVKDQNCITSKGAGTALEFALELVSLLYSGETVEGVKKGLAL